MKKKKTIVIFLTLFLMFLVGSLHAFTLIDPDVSAQNAYKPTKRAWKKVYKSLVENSDSVKGTTYITPIKGNGYVDRLHKNKARDTIVFIPNTTTIAQPLDLIFYFHGLGGFKERDFRTRILKHTPSTDPENNYIVIIPEMPWSKNTSTPTKRQGRVFTKKADFPNFIKSILDIVNLHFKNSCGQYCPVHHRGAHSPRKLAVGKVILIGHSAGGSTLMSISRSGGLNWLYDSTKASYVKVVFSDASYGRWLDITWKYFKPYAGVQTDFIVLTRKWDRPHRNAKRFLKKFKKVPINIKHVVFDRKEITHAGIGDQAFKWAYLFPAVNESGCGEGERNE